MGLFEIFKGKKNPKLRITEPDRNWVEENFEWLISTFGYPSKDLGIVQFTEEYFQDTLKGDEISINNLMSDLNRLFYFSSDLISFEILSDVSDLNSIPIQEEGLAFESDTAKIANRYVIHLSSIVVKDPNRLIHRLILEYVKVQLLESNVDFENGEDTSLFVYMAGVYFGLGVVLSHDLIGNRRVSNEVWETQWSFRSEMPMQILTFILALHSALIDDLNPNWISSLPQDVKGQFNLAIDFFKENPSRLFNNSELESMSLLKISSDLYLKGKYDDAISTTQKILSLTKDDLLKVECYNNIGYYYFRNGDIKESVNFYQKAINQNSNYGYAYDNMALSCLLMGELEKGEEFIKRANETDNNDLAYSKRNEALLHHKRNNLEEAKKCFEEAIEFGGDNVDLLEYHYSLLLFDVGDLEKAKKFVNLSFSKGEQEGVQFMKKL